MAGNAGVIGGGWTKAQPHQTHTWPCYLHRFHLDTACPGQSLTFERPPGLQALSPGFLPAFLLWSSSVAIAPSCTREPLLVGTGLSLVAWGLAASIPTVAVVYGRACLRLSPL